MGKEIDQSSGNVISKATISGSVYDLTGKRAKKIASVSPQVLAGLGSIQEESISIALSNSAEESAKQLINALNNKGQINEICIKFCNFINFFFRC